MVHEQADAFQFERVAPEIHPEDWIPMHLECVLEDTNGAFPLHGTVRYSSLLGVFHWVLNLVPGTFLVPPQPRFQASHTVTKT